MLFGATGTGPMMIAEGAMIIALIILITSNIAIWTKRCSREVVAVAIEVILGKIFIPLNAIFATEAAGLFPSEGLDFE